MNAARDIITDARDTLKLAERSFVRGSFRRAVERAAETIAAERGLDTDELARMTLDELACLSPEEERERLVRQHMIGSVVGSTINKVLLTVALALTLAIPAAAHEPYSRDAFPHWIDADRDCQDARSEALRLTGEVTGKCRVELVAMVDRYTGESYAGPASRIDVDHLVPLAEAWRSGADGWTAEQRRAFANDLDNLVPTAASVNRGKGDRDPAEWTPPDAGAWCWYGKAWLEIKARYALAMDGAEVAAVVGLLGWCGVAP